MESLLLHTAESAYLGRQFMKAMAYRPVPLLGITATDRPVRQIM